MKHRIIKKTAYLLAILGLSSQLGNARDTRLFTTQDGTTWDKYVTYLKLTGTQSATLPIEPPPTFNEPLDYSVLLWFKPQSPTTDQWTTRYQYCFEFTDSLECLFTGTGQLMCDSTNKMDKIQVDARGVGNNQWAHIAVMGQPRQGSYLIVSTNEGEITRDQRGYVALQQTSQDPWRMCLGGCQTHSGFQGSFREIKIINQFLTPEQASKLKNQYLLYDKRIMGYFRFAENDFAKDEFRNVNANIEKRENNIVKYVNNIEEIKARDLIPNDICYPINQIKQYLNVSQGAAEIAPMIIDSRWIPQNKGWGYSLNLWINIGTDTCAASRPAEAMNNCYLVLLKDSFMLYLLPDKNQIAIYIFNPKPIYEQVSKTLFVPQNQWVNIQLGVNQYNGYDLRTYDILGKLTGIVTENKDLLQQKVNSKQLLFFKNFKGVVKSLLFLTERRQLPLLMPPVNATRGTFYDDDRCLAYLSFEPENVFSNFTGLAKLLNFCKSPQYTSLNLTLTTLNLTRQDLPLSGLYFQDSPSQTPSTFDGLACDDGSLVNTFINEQSYVKTELLTPQTEVTELSVELWIKSDIVSRDAQVLSIGTAKREYFAIKKVGKEMVCEALAEGQNKNYSAKFKEYRAGEWTHIACMVDRAGAITGIMQTQAGYNETIQGGASQADNAMFTMGNESQTVIMGNSPKLQEGWSGMKMRDLRIWSSLNSNSDINNWRYRQIDISSVGSRKLWAYFRFAEGDHRYFNLANLNLQTNPVQQRGMTLMMDVELLLCPVSTFPSADRSRCYKDPVTVPIVSIYPVYRQSDNMMGWRFSIEDSQLVSKDFASEIKVKWEFEDQIIKSIASQEANMKTFIIPANAFRENARYKLRVNMTNHGDMSFNNVQHLTFVPISCQYFLVNSRSANTVYVNYTNQQSSENITFTLNLIQAKNYCSEIAFFKDIDPSRLSYKIVYEQDIQLDLNQVPALITKWDDKLKQFLITIPKSEQYKFPLHTDIKFIFNLPWETKEHKDLYPSTDLTFQHALLTLNFRKEGSILMPFLETKTPLIFADEVAIFDASDTYITYRPLGEQKKDLTFVWICPKPLDKVCSLEQTSILRIAYKDFKEAKLEFNKTIEIKLRYEWINRVNDTDIMEVSELQTPAVWLNISVPSFDLAGPSQVLLTAEFNRFSASLYNYELPDLSILDVQWSIVPNISFQNLPLTFNKTLLTLPKGALQPRTSYKISVTFQNKLYKFLKKSQTLEFTTTSPPEGGIMKIDPTSGVIGETEFAVTVANWNSQSEPVMYQVWATSDSGGEKQYKQMTEDWTVQGQDFKFKHINSNPLIVYIKDAIGEIIKKRLVVMIKVPAKTDQTKLLSELELLPQPDLKIRFSASNPVGDSTLQRYTLMSQFLDQPESNQTEPTQNNQTFTNKTVANLSTTDQILAVYDTISDDLSNLTSSLDLVEQVFILQQSLKIFSLVLNHTQLPIEIVNKTVELTAQVVEAMKPIGLEVVGSDMQKSEVVQGISTIVGQVIRYKIEDVDEADTTDERRRRLQEEVPLADNNTDSTNNQTDQETYALELKKIMDVKRDFSSLLCSLLSDQSEYVKSGSYDFLLSKLSADSSAPGLLLSYQGDNSTFNLSLSSLSSDLLADLSNPSFCLDTTFYTFDFFSTFNQTAMNLTQLSTITSSLQLVNSTIDMKSYVAYTYQMRKEVNLTIINQTINGRQMTNQTTNEEKTDDEGRRRLQDSDNTTANPAAEGNLTNDTTTTVNDTTPVNVTSPVNDTSPINETNPINGTNSVNETTPVNTTNSNFEEPKVIKKIACMGYSQSRELWDETMCKTEIRYETNDVVCQCTSVDNLFQGVFLVNEILTEKVSVIEVSNARPFIAITVVMGLITIFIPLCASILDWRDITDATQMEIDLPFDQRRIHQKVLDIQPSLWYWFLIHHQDASKETLISQTIQKLPLGTIIKMTHPLLNMLTRYDGQRKSRLFRIMPWLAQTAIYTILIVIFSENFFQAEESQEELKSGSISEMQALHIIQAGFAGMFALLPWPYVGKFIRRSTHQNRVISSEGNDNSFQIRQSVANGVRLGSEEAIQGDGPSFLQKISQSHRIDSDRMPSGLNRFLAISSLALSAAATVVSVVILMDKPLSIQHCTVAAYFMGVFGSLLCTHFIYGFWQYLLYLFLYEETNQLPTAQSLQFGSFETSRVKTIVFDSAINTHIFEQIVVKRASIESTRNSFKATGKTPGVLNKSKNDTSQLNPSIIQAYVGGHSEINSQLGGGVEELLDNYNSNTPDKGLSAKIPLATRSPIGAARSTERNHNTMHQTDLDYEDEHPPQNIMDQNNDQIFDDEVPHQQYQQIGKIEEEMPPPTEKKIKAPSNSFEMKYSREMSKIEHLEISQEGGLNGSVSNLRVEAETKRVVESSTPQAESLRQSVNVDQELSPRITNALEDNNQNYNSSGRLEISRDDDVYTSKKAPDTVGKGIQKQFYGGEESARYQEQGEDELHDPYASHDSAKKRGLKLKIGGSESTSQTKMQQKLSTSFSKKDHQELEDVAYSPIPQIRKSGQRPLTSVNPQPTYGNLQDQDPAKNQVWMQDEQDEAGQTDLNIADDNEDLNGTEQL